jgi:hypothetical protein
LQTDRTADEAALTAFDTREAPSMGGVDLIFMRPAVVIRVDLVDFHRDGHTVQRLNAARPSRERTPGRRALLGLGCREWFGIISARMGVNTNPTEPLWHLPDPRW